MKIACPTLALTNSAAEDVDTYDREWSNRLLYYWTGAMVDKFGGLTLTYDFDGVRHGVNFHHAKCGSQDAGAMAAATILSKAGFGSYDSLIASITTSDRIMFRHPGWYTELDDKAALSRQAIGEDERFDHVCVVQVHGGMVICTVPLSADEYDAWRLSEAGVCDYVQEYLQEIPALKATSFMMKDVKIRAH